MTDRELIDEVRRRAGLEDRRLAEVAAAATIRQLVGKLSWREKLDLAAALPPKLRRTAQTAANTDLRFAPPAQLLRELADELLVSSGEAAEIARAVASVIKELIAPEELLDLRAELLRTYDTVFG